MGQSQTNWKRKMKNPLRFYTRREWAAEKQENTIRDKIYNGSLTLTYYEYRKLFGFYNHQNKEFLQYGDRRRFNKGK